MKKRTTLAVPAFTCSAALFAGTPSASAGIADAPCDSQAGAFDYYTTYDGSAVVTIRNCSFYAQTLGMYAYSPNTGYYVTVACTLIGSKGSATRDIGKLTPIRVVSC
jgi:hypothetical protein